MSFYFQQDTHARTHTQWRPPGVAGVRAEAADGAATVSGSALHQQRAHRDTFLPPLGFICAALFWKLAAGDGAWSGRAFHLDNMLYSWIPAVWIPAVALLFGFQGKGGFHSLMSCAGVRKLRSWGEITATVEGFCSADSRCEGMWRDRDPTQCTDRRRGPVSWCPVLHGRVQLQHVECACVRAYSIQSVLVVFLFVCLFVQVFFLHQIRSQFHCTVKPQQIRCNGVTFIW